MELLSVIAAFFVAVSFLLVPCASDQVNAQKSLKHYGNSEVHHAQITLPLLPRKLKHQEDVMKSSSDRDIMALSGGKLQNKKEENVMQKGTWREWAEGPNKSEYFTMDYHWVRRRRPIHNKRVPFVP